MSLEIINVKNIAAQAPIKNKIGYCILFDPKSISLQFVKITKDTKQTTAIILFITFSFAYFPIYLA